MNFWHIQLDQGEDKLSSKEFKKIVEDISVIGMGDQWDNDGGAPKRFEKEVSVGDIFVIRHGGAPRYLVEVIGDCKKNENADEIDVWFPLYREIRIINDEGPFYKEEYKNKTGKNWTIGLFSATTFQTANNWEFAKYWYTHIKDVIIMRKTVQLLTANHNLILTGAPGTGKTFLAKQIAQQMIFGEIKDEMNPNEKKQFDEQCDFVQFHPSYDYTDFVEGLRPVKSIKDDIKNIGFERKNGAFKAFCKKALDSTLPVEQNEKNIENYEGLYSRMIASLKPGDTFTERGGKKVTVADVTIDTNTISLTLENESNESFTKERLIEFVEKYSNGKKLYNEFASEAISGNASAYWAVANYFYEYYYKHIPFVFIIDEINRGEISKIFGELFFSIDPGYRGKEKGKIKTQYQNLIEQGDVFYDGFYVPENVYIIGTMNDIDRSVESMDFAFRRRFAFKEITAEYSKQMLDSDDAWGKDENGNSRKPDQVDIDTIKSKMDAINNVIWHKVKEDVKDEDKSIEGLSSAYHIGASYFLKLVNYKNADGSYDYDQLWENHLEGLLLEYMRGMADVQKKIKKLANAYGYSKMNKYE